MPEVRHPVVKVHPFTGRKCLFVNEGFTAAIEGMHDPRVLSDLVTGLGRAATSVEAREVLAGALGYSNSRP